MGDVAKECGEWGSVFRRRTGWKSRFVRRAGSFSNKEESSSGFHSDTVLR